MKKWIIGTLIGFGALALGVAGAFAYDTVNPVDSTEWRPGMRANLTDQRGWDRSGMGMRSGGRGYNTNVTGEWSVSAEEAETIAAQYLADEGLTAEVTGESFTMRHGYMFEYSIDGEDTGFVHVNAYTGQANLCPVNADLDSD